MGDVWPETESERRPPADSAPELKREMRVSKIRAFFGGGTFVI